FIEVIDLVKVYKMGSLEVQALRGLNLRIDKGDFIAIIGPSGSGKTTLLNILGGLDSPTAGQARIGNSNLNTMNRKDRILFRRETVGHIFQNLNLIPTLTARENIELPLVAAKTSSTNRIERISKLVEILGMDERIDHT
ncbi:unnamed protein product, partial [marine sediment metagenome]